MIKLEPQKRLPGKVLTFNLDVVERVVLAVAVCFLSWTANSVVQQGRQLVAHDVRLAFDAGRLDTLETHGSRGLESHESMDNARIGSITARLDKLELAFVALAGVPARLDALHDGQARIEKVLDDRRARMGILP